MDITLDVSISGILAKFVHPLNVLGIAVIVLVSHLVMLVKLVQFLNVLLSDDTPCIFGLFVAVSTKLAHPLND